MNLTQSSLRYVTYLQHSRIFIIPFILSPFLLGFLSAQTWQTEHVMRADSTKVYTTDKSISDFAWMKGHWEGTGLGGKVEETWSRPNNGVMVGTFRLMSGEDTEFYEICWIEQNAGQLAYKVKHFSKDFEAWEEKKEYVSFRFLEQRGDMFYFDGLTIMRQGEKLIYYIAFEGQDGNALEQKFHFSSY